jgi:hypothetical protein
MGRDDAERFLEKKKRTHTVQTVVVVDQQTEINFFLMARQTLVSFGTLIVEALRSHSIDTAYSIGLFWTSGQALRMYLYLTTQHSQETGVNAHGGIATRTPSNRAAADPSLRTRGHWDRLKEVCTDKKLIHLLSRTASVLEELFTAIFLSRYIIL